MSRRLLSMLLVASCLLLAACGGHNSADSAGATSARVVSEGAARDALADAVGVVGSGDLEELCSSSANSRMCEGTLAELGPRSAPTDAEPEIVDTYAVEPQRSDGGGTRGGRVLRVCGLDGQGDRYLTELMVIMDSEGPVLMNPVYWSGYRVAGDSGGSDGATASAEATMPRPDGSPRPDPLPSVCP